MSAGLGADPLRVGRRRRPSGEAPSPDLCGRALARRHRGRAEDAVHGALCRRRSQAASPTEKRVHCEAIEQVNTIDARGRPVESLFTIIRFAAQEGSGAMHALLSYELSVLSENRNNFAVAMTVLPPTGTSERDAAAILVQEEVNAGRRPETVGADRKYSDGDSLVLNLAALSVRSHFAVRDDRPNALARCFHDDTGYSVSIRCRMRIEEIFAYLKTICGLDKVKVRGLFRVWGESLLALSAYNLTHEAHLPRF